MAELKRRKQRAFDAATARARCIPETRDQVFCCAQSRRTVQQTSVAVSLTQRLVVVLEQSR